MTRINLGGGRWFNPETARCWSEDTRWNGSNHISVNTGSQWEHEELYLTKSGTYILHYWSQYQGSRDRYETVSDAIAIQWLIDNDHGDALESLGCAKELAAAEL